MVDLCFILELLYLVSYLIIPCFFAFGFISNFKFSASFVVCKVCNLQFPSFPLTFQGISCLFWCNSDASCIFLASLSGFSLKGHPTVRHRVAIKPGCFETGQIANTPGETGETKTNNVNEVCQLVLEIWISVHISHPCHPCLSNGFSGSVL